MSLHIELFDNDNNLLANKAYAIVSTISEKIV